MLADLPGVLFQPLLLDDIQGREGRRARDRVPAERRDCLLYTSLLKTVGLESRIDHMPVEMSGGEQQRVAVARALANKPSVILGDEPTGDLDSKSAEALMDLIVSLRKDRKMTFILVTHDPLVVVECDRVYSVRDGKILRMQTKAENRKIIGDERSMLSKLY